jgi:hypothetical protein
MMMMMMMMMKMMMMMMMMMIGDDDGGVGYDDGQDHINCRMVKMLYVFACNYEEWDVAELLLMNGADPDVKDKVSVMFNDDFTDPYHLYLYCMMPVIDEVVYIFSSGASHSYYKYRYYIYIIVEL